MGVCQYHRITCLRKVTMLITHCFQKVPTSTIKIKWFFHELYCHPYFKVSMSVVLIVVTSVDEFLLVQPEAYRRNLVCGHWIPYWGCNGIQSKDPQFDTVEPLRGCGWHQGLFQPKVLILGLYPKWALCPERRQALVWDYKVPGYTTTTNTWLVVWIWTLCYDWVWFRFMSYEWHQNTKRKLQMEFQTEQ